jgi:hypothetical protein
MLMPSFNVTVQLHSIPIGYENILDGCRRGTGNGGSSGRNCLDGPHCLNPEHGCIQTGHFGDSASGAGGIAGRGWFGLPPELRPSIQEMCHSKEGMRCIKQEM